MITIVVKPDGEEPYKVTADSRDVCKWECQHHRNSLKRFIENPSMMDHYALAHLAIQRLQLRDPGELSDFRERNAIKVIDQNEMLDFEELTSVIDKALTEPAADAASVAGEVIALLERIRMRASDPNPTLPGH